MSERDVVIFGGKGTAINVALQIEDARRRHGYPMRVIGFAIDDPALGREIAGFPVVSGLRNAWETLCATGVDFIFALFRPDVMAERLALLNELNIPEHRFANFIHPSAYVSATVKMGFGNVVLSQATLQHAVSLGNFNIINSGVVVEHESIVADGSFLAASACVGARVQIGNSAFVGLNATIREDVRVGDRAFIGMGACVLQPVDPGAVVFGVPARPTK